MSENEHRDSKQASDLKETNSDASLPRSQPDSNCDETCRESSDLYLIDCSESDFESVLSDITDPSLKFPHRDDDLGNHPQEDSEDSQNIHTTPNSPLLREHAPNSRNTMTDDDSQTFASVSSDGDQQIADNRQPSENERSGFKTNDIPNRSCELQGDALSLSPEPDLSNQLSNQVNLTSCSLNSWQPGRFTHIFPILVVNQMYFLNSPSNNGRNSAASLLGHHMYVPLKSINGEEMLPVGTREGKNQLKQYVRRIVFPFNDPDPKWTDLSFKAFVKILKSCKKVNLLQKSIMECLMELLEEADEETQQSKLKSWLKYGGTKIDSCQDLKRGEYPIFVSLATIIEHAQQVTERGEMEKVRKVLKENKCELNNKEAKVQCLSYSLVSQSSTLGFLKLANILVHFSGEQHKKFNQWCAALLFPDKMDQDEKKSLRKELLRIKSLDSSQNPGNGKGPDNESRTSKGKRQRNESTDNPQTEKKHCHRSHLILSQFILQLLHGAGLMFRNKLGFAYSRCFQILQSSFVSFKERYSRSLPLNEQPFDVLDQKSDQESPEDACGVSIHFLTLYYRYVHQKAERDSGEDLDLNSLNMYKIVNRILPQNSVVTTGGQGSKSVRDDWSICYHTMSSESESYNCAQSLVSLLRSGSEKGEQLKCELLALATTASEKDFQSWFRTPSRYVCYAWKLPFVQFVDAIRSTFLRSNSFVDDEYLWIDAFALPQANVQNLHIKNDPLDSTPKRVWSQQLKRNINRATKGLLIIANEWNAPNVLSRSWCWLEISFALSLNKALQLALTNKEFKKLEEVSEEYLSQTYSEDNMLAKVDETIKKMSFEESECSEPEDQALIQELFLSSENSSHVQGQIRSSFVELLLKPAEKRIQNHKGGINPTEFINKVRPYLAIENLADATLKIAACFTISGSSEGIALIDGVVAELREQITNLPTLNKRRQNLEIKLARLLSSQGRMYGDQFCNETVPNALRCHEEAYNIMKRNDCRALYLVEYFWARVLVNHHYNLFNKNNHSPRDKVSDLKKAEELLDSSSKYLQNNEPSNGTLGAIHVHQAKIMDIKSAPHSEVLEKFERALDIQTAIYGPRDMRCAMTVRCLGMSHAYRGSFSRALGYWCHTFDRLREGSEARSFSAEQLLWLLEFIMNGFKKWRESNESKLIYGEQELDFIRTRGEPTLRHILQASDRKVLDAHKDLVTRLLRWVQRKLRRTVVCVTDITIAHQIKEDLSNEHCSDVDIALKDADVKSILQKKIVAVVIYDKDFWKQSDIKRLWGETFQNEKPHFIHWRDYELLNDETLISELATAVQNAH